MLFSTSTTTLLTFTLFLILTTVQAVQISFSASLSPQVANIADIDGGYNINGLQLIKDTAQAHYESMIDDILSQHNEGLLTELSIIIKDPKQMHALMKPQADLLFGDVVTCPSTIQDICVAQMPGMIANHIHELSNEIYLSIDWIVSKYWTETDAYYRNLILNAIHHKGLWEQEVMNELVNSIQVLNMDIADSISQMVTNYNLLNKLKESLLKCQAVFNGDEVKLEELSLTEKIWSAVLISFKHSNPPVVDLQQEEGYQRRGFMGRYLFELKSDIQSEIYSRVYELARSIYEDLAFLS